MANRKLLGTLTGAALALVLGSISVPGTAATYDSGFDPSAFSGTARFNVADACLLADGFHNNAGACTITWLSANVTFREAPPGNRTTSFNYSNVLPDSNAVSNIFVAGGELAGVNSAAIGPRIISGDPVPGFNGPWWIQYNFTNNQINAPVPDGSGLFGLGTVSLFGGFCDGPCFRDPKPRETANVTFFHRVSAVPEPGTLSLLLAALGFWWIGKRRKSAA